MATSEPSAIRRQLGAELRIVRTTAGVNQRDMATAVGVHPGTISRIENAEGRLVGRPFVTAWLDRCNPPRDVRARVLALLDAAHAETRPWAQLLDAEPTQHLQGLARELERDARVLRVYEMSWIPGLLQTAGYARALMPLVDPTGRMDYAAAVHARMQRQQILYETERRFEFLIAAHVFEWSPAPGVMVAQKHAIALGSTLDNVEIRVLPNRREGTPAWHSFQLIETDDETEVTAELLGGQWRVTDAETVEQYRAVWDDLWAVARPP